MTNGAVAETLNIGQLLTDDQQYRIPDYQRNYAWKAAEISQLIEDIRQAQQADQPRYFLGNLVTTQPDPLNTVYEVVDGQQRLTTLVLLLSALRIEVGPNHNVELPETAQVLTFVARPQASAALKRLAQATSFGESALAGVSSRTRVEDETEGIPGSVQGLYDGYTAIETTLAEIGLTTPEALEGFLTYLLLNVEVVRVVLPQGTDLNRYFEVMNTRGVQLEPTDIVRARLLAAFHDPDDPNSAHKRRTFQHVWDSCAQMDSYLQISLSRENTALRTQLFGPDWRWFQISHFDGITELLEPPSPAEDDSITSDRSLESVLTAYEHSVQDDTGSEVKENQTYRSTIRFPFFLLHALILFAEREKLSLSELSAAHNPGSGASPGHDADPTLDDKQLLAQFNRIFEHAEPEMVGRFAIHLLQVRNIYDAYIIRREEGDAGTDDGAWMLKTLEELSGGGSKRITYRNTFGRESEEVSGAGISKSRRQDPNASETEHLDVVLLESLLRITYTSPRTMRWITLVLRHGLEHHYPDGSLQSQSISANSMVTMLRDYIRSRIPAEYRWQPPSFNDEKANEARASGFDIPRIVYTYLDFLLLGHPLPQHTDGNVYRPIPKSTFTFRFRNSVEHFSPSTPDKDLRGELVNEDWKQSLGNLALITVSQNSKFSNASPKAKATTHDEILQQSPKLWRMAYLTNATGWNNTTIAKHYAECLRLLYKDLTKHSSGV